MVSWSLSYHNENNRHLFLAYYKMNVKLVLVLSLLFGVYTATAQTFENDYSGMIANATIEGAIPLNAHSKIHLNNLSLELGYAFNKRWSLYVPITGTVAFFLKKDPVRRYEPSWAVGLGAGYSVLRKEHNRLDVMARVGHTLFGKKSDSNWKYTSYDVGVRYSDNEICSGAVEWFYGIGLSYYHCNSGPMDNFFNIYALTGFRFGR